MSKDKLIPELRFPEFLEKEGWEIKEVGEIFQVTRGYVLSMTLVKELPTEDYPYPVFSSQTKNNGLAGYYNEYLYEDAITWTTDGANAGDVNYRDGKFYCTNVCGVLLNEEGIANPCIAELINSVSKKHVSYVGNPKLMNGVMSKIQIPVPSIKEQQKIASCLSSLDELKAAHKDKLDALKDHKKGLLQNLFPSAGETVPKVRFPEFEGDGEWVEKKLIDTTDKKVKWSFTGGPFGSNLKANDYTTEGIRIIQLQNIGDGMFNDDNKIYTSIEKADELLSCNIYAGDIIISKMGDPVGRACIIPNNLERCVMASDGIRLVVDENKFSKYFIYSLLNSKRIRKTIQSKSTGSTRKRIGLNPLRETELIVPKDLKEQQKIASCLSAVDELITAQQEKIDELQQHKKGLMQGLFPKIES